jgi:hypothetical protein
VISDTKVKARWDGKEVPLTLVEAWNKYIKQQQDGGPVKLEFQTYNALKNKFEYMYPVGFFKNEAKVQDIIIFRLDLRSLKGKRDEVDVPVAATSKLLIQTHNSPSLLVAQAILNFQMGKCSVAITIPSEDKKTTQVVYVPALSAEKRKEDAKYKYPAKDLAKTADVFRVLFRDGSALVTEFVLAG